MSDKKYYRAMLGIAIPVLLQNLISISISLLDTLMIGLLGENELAAVGAANQFYMIFAMTNFGFFSGAMAYLAQFWGIRDVKTVRKVFGIDILVGQFFAFVSLGVALLFAPQIITVFSRDANVISLGSEYIRIVCLCYPISSLTFAIGFNCRAVERLRATTIASVVGLVVNGGLNYVLIFGKLGFPALGVRGAAIATCVARVVEMCIVITVVRVDKRHPLRITLSDVTQIPKDLARRVIKTAVPVIATEVIWASCTAGVFAAYGILGPSAQAVSQVGTTVTDIFQSIYFGVGNATAVLLGGALGRGEKETAFTYAKRAMVICWILNVIMTVLLILLRHPIADEIYHFSPETTKLLKDSLMAMALTISPKMFAYVLLCGIMRAGGDTYFSLYADMSFNVLSIPMAYLGVSFFKWSLPWVIVFVAMAEVAKCVVCYMRVRSKKWMNQVT